VGRLKAEERLKEEGKSRRSEVVVFRLFRLFRLFCAIDGPFLNRAPNDARLWVGWFWLGMQGCA
jgi:hypothetical protein